MSATAVALRPELTASDPIRSMTGASAYLLGAAALFGSVLFYCFTNVVVHEAGHLICARLVGWKPVALRLGSGEMKTLFTLGDVDFQIGKRIFAGSALAYADSPKRYRLSLLIFVMGGPMASAVLAGLLLYAALLSHLGELPESWYTAIFLLFCFQCLVVLRSLWPTSTGASMNDGALMWRTLRMKPDDVSKEYLSHPFHLSLWLFRRGRQEDARQEMGKIFSPTYNDTFTRAYWAYWLHLLSESGLAAEARQEVARGIDGAADLESRLTLLDSLASLPLWQWKPALVADALSYIDQAIAEAPDQITLQATKGGLLILGDQIDTGLSLIKTVQEKSTTPSDLELAAYFEALAHFRLGQAEKAAELLDAAIAQFPKFSLRPKIEAEIRAPARNKPQ